MTQVGEERTPASQAEFYAVPVPSWPGARVGVEAGTLMQKLVPPHLVEPYLTRQRSVITGYVQRAQDGVVPDPVWFGGAEGEASAAGPEAEAGAGAAGLEAEAGAGASGLEAEAGASAAGLFVLRWRALDIHTYLAAAGGGPAAGASSGLAFAVFLTLCPIPVGAEMYRISAAGEDFVARYDGQSWLQPGPAEG